MRIFQHSKNTITNFSGDSNMLTEFVDETGTGSVTFDITNSRFLAILNTDAIYLDVTVSGTDSLNQAFSYDERVYFTAATVDQMINNEYAQFYDNILDFEKFLITASVTITLPSETNYIGILLSGYFIEFAAAYQDGFSRTLLNTYVKNRSKLKKKYPLSCNINTMQALERLFKEEQGEYFLCTIPSDEYGGFFSEYGKINVGDNTMQIHDKVKFNLEVER